MTQASQRSVSYSFNISWVSTNEGGVNTSRYEQVFNPPIFLDSTDYEIAVISLETYYSFPNITEGFNNAFGYKANPTDPTTIISLPTGSYAITDIASEIQRQVTDPIYNNMILSKNDATLKSIFKLSPSYRIDFTIPNNVGSVLGFNNEIVGGIVNQKYYPGENIVNILNVNTILVNCDIVNNSYNNGRLAPVIYSFFPDVAPGYKIVRNVESPIYLPINRSQINSIAIWLTDENNNFLNFRGETISIRFHLRNKK